jgi:hypothetical protein
VDPTAKICDPLYSQDAAKLYMQLRYPPYSACRNPCTRMDVKLYSMSKIMPEEYKNTARVKFLLSSKIEINEEVLHQTLLSLFAEIGGYLGLILGVSLLDLKILVTMIIEVFMYTN